MYPTIGNMSTSTVSAPQSGMGPKRAQRSEALRQQLERSGLSDEAASWFIHAADPMRDDDVIAACGYPDADRSNTVISDILTEVTITLPTAGDLHIATTGIISTIAPSSLPPTYAGSLTQLGGSTTYGPSAWNGPPYAATVAEWPSNYLIYTYAGVGQDTFPSSTSSPIPNSVVTGGLDITKGFLQGTRGDQAVRLVGFGFEAINTTPVLTKGGSVICYSQPNPQTLDLATLNQVSQVSNLLVGGLSPSPVLYLQSPPSNAGDARLLHGSTEWGAEQGAYVVNTQTAIENPLQGTRSLPVILYNNSSNTPEALGSAVEYTRNVTATTTSGTSVTGASPTLDESYIAPFQQTGIYFTGLPAGSTIVLRARAKIEIAVQSSIGLLATLAKPSTGYEPKALQLLASVMHKAPVAVPFGDNPAGEWLMKIAQIAKFASPVISGFFPGSGPLVSGAISLMENQAKKMAERELARDKLEGPAYLKEVEKDERALAKAKKMIEDQKAANKASSKSKKSKKDRK